ncbi:GntR family transcriptional regulator [Monashia sp. NPDC004114]
MPADRTDLAAPTLGAAHRSLRDEVADELRDRIVNGTLEPGQRLVERVLAEELGVSRVPVRDALVQLRGEGFVTEVPRKGVFVTAMSEHDVRELFNVREALEVLAVRLATEGTDQAELRRLREILDQSAAAIRASDVLEVGRCNQAFHDQITAMAHNDLLASILEPLEGRLHWLLRQNDDPSTFHDEHEEIYRAVASGDVVVAQEVSLRHVRTSRDVCLRLLSARQQLT